MGSLLNRNREWLRLALLGLAALLIYWPFIFSGNIGATDAYWYHEIAADVIQQNQHGIFPIYVGQSLFNFSGIPMGRAPYYLMLVSVLNLLTLHTLTSLEIQHLTVIVSAIAATYIMYFALTNIAPKLRWPAFAFAILYISCPGVIALIDRMDMYVSFMTIPYLALLIYALIRHYQKNDMPSSVLLAMSLSLLWMAHPPIALWSTAICVIFCGLSVIFQPKVISGLLFAALLFLLLNLWHFTTVLSLGMGSAYAVTSFPVAELIATLKSCFPGAFLPVDINNIAFLQLGYSLWLAVLLGVVIGMKQQQLLIKFLLICMLFLIILLYPFPHLTTYLWSHIPEFVRNITLMWPMERFYAILAALACFIGMLALKNIDFDKHPSAHYTVNTTLVIAVCWSLLQAYPFMLFSHDQLRRSDTAEPSASWLLPENIRFIGDYTTPTYQPNMLANIYDPALNNRLLDTNNNVVANFSNTQLITQTCLNNQHTIPQSAHVKIKLHFPAHFASPLNLPLMDLQITPGKKYLLCVAMTYPNTKGSIEVLGHNHLTRSDFDASFTRNKQLALLIPIFTTENMAKELHVNLSATAINTNQPSPVTLKAIGFITYDATTLPIKLISLIPYHLTVNNPLHSAYLETAQQFVPGYVALVNGEKRQVLRSPIGRVMVPLALGNNDITLIYTGTLLIRLAFYISLLAWLAVIFYLLRTWYREKIN